MRPSVEFHPVLVGFDDVRLGFDHLDSARDEVAPGLHHVVLAVHAEGDEQEARLVVVGFHGIDDRDLPLVGVEQAAQAIDDHRARRPGADDQQSLHE